MATLRDLVVNGNITSSSDIYTDGKFYGKLDWSQVQNVPTVSTTTNGIMSKEDYNKFKSLSSLLSAFKSGYSTIINAIKEAGGGTLANTATASQIAAAIRSLKNSSVIGAIANMDYQYFDSSPYRDNDTEYFYFQTLAQANTSYLNRWVGYNTQNPYASGWAPMSHSGGGGSATEYKGDSFWHPETGKEGTASNANTYVELYYQYRDYYYDYANEKGVYDNGLYDYPTYIYDGCILGYRIVPTSASDGTWTFQLCTYDENKLNQFYDGTLLKLSQCVLKSYTIFNIAKKNITYDNVWEWHIASWYVDAYWINESQMMLFYYWEYPNNANYDTQYSAIYARLLTIRGKNTISVGTQQTLTDALAYNAGFTYYTEDWRDWVPKSWVNYHDDDLFLYRIAPYTVLNGKSSSWFGMRMRRTFLARAVNTCEGRWDSNDNYYYSSFVTYEEAEPSYAYYNREATLSNTDFKFSGTAWSATASWNPNSTFAVTDTYNDWGKTTLCQSGDFVYDRYGYTTWWHKSANGFTRRNQIHFQKVDGTKYNITNTYVAKSTASPLLRGTVYKYPYSTSNFYTGPNHLQIDMTYNYMWEIYTGWTGNKTDGWYYNGGNSVYDWRPHYYGLENPYHFAGVTVEGCLVLVCDNVTNQYDSYCYLIDTYRDSATYTALETTSINETYLKTINVGKLPSPYTTNQAINSTLQMIKVFDGNLAICQLYIPSAGHKTGVGILRRDWSQPHFEVGTGGDTDYGRSNWHVDFYSVT